MCKMFIIIINSFIDNLLFFNNSEYKNFFACGVSFINPKILIIKKEIINNKEIILRN